MGWSCHFLLVRDGDPLDVATRLGGRLDTEVIDAERATTRDAPGPAVGPLINGWLMVTDAHGQLFGDKYGTALSQGGHVLEFFIEEHVSFAAAVSLRDGKTEWSLTYAEGQLTAAGEVPRIAVEGDEFDAPAEVIYRLTGWMYDDEFQDEPFAPVLGLPPPDGGGRRRRR
jgi:hypothetical protein